MKIGYVRVSTEEQNTARQEIMLRELGVDELFIDKASGKNADRPELRRMMEYVRRGDTVIVESISRFARNTRDLLDLVERLTEKQVEFVSRKEAIDTTTPTGKFMLTVFAAVAELEREYILQRQREGIAIAKAQGKYRGKAAKDYPDFERVVARWRSGEITAVQAPEGESLREAILRERAVEFGYEEVRYFDLIRWKRYDRFSARLSRLVIKKDSKAPSGFSHTISYEMAEERQYIKPKLWSDKYYLLPLPVDEINKKYGLIQNPGW